jgi:undecaprenyl diphosphate synthase
MFDSKADIKSVPTHIAIIMDGNGRWAKARGLPRTIGHKNGAEAVKRTVRNAAEIGIKYLTLFGFSSENWSRPVAEVTELMKLLKLYLKSETAELHRNNIKLKVIGDKTHFDDELVKMMNYAEELTGENTAIQVNIALNYGSRDEILKAASAWALECARQGKTPDLDQAELYFEDFLMTKDIPDPDMIIRTSGEQRVSNFLLWQAAYTEFYFTDTYWPDFGENDLINAIQNYNKRERRFGSVAASE